MIRFMADADLNYAIGGGCRRREPAIDFLSANDANLEGVPDPDVLALAAAVDRILVSHDFQTMPRHFGDFLQAHGSSPGLILVPQHMAMGEVIEELVLIWGASEAEEWRNRWRALPAAVQRALKFEFAESKEPGLRKHPRRTGRPAAHPIPSREPVTPRPLLRPVIASN